MISIFVDWFKIMLKDLVWVGDNDLGVVLLVYHGCGICCWERLLATNCMVFSCKLKGIILIPIMNVMKVMMTKHVKVI